jgi:hypothetical protein
MVRGETREQSRDEPSTALDGRMSHRFGLEVGVHSTYFGARVDALVADTDDCVVFLDDALNIWWHTDAETTPEFGHVLSRVSELEGIPLEGLSPAVRRAFRTMVAQGVARALDDGDNVAALRLHDRAEAFVRARLGELARGWTLTAALQALAVAAIVGLTWAMMPSSEYTGFVTCVCAGAAGASLSLMSRLGSFPLDPASGQRLHVLEATARVFVGMLGAFVTFLGVRARVIFPALADGGSAPMLLISFAAGAIERFVPPIVQRFDVSRESRAPDVARAAASSRTRR